MVCLSGGRTMRFKSDEQRKAVMARLKGKAMFLGPQATSPGPDIIMGGRYGRKVIARTVPNEKFRYVVYARLHGECGQQTHYTTKPEAERFAEILRGPSAKEFGFSDVEVRDALKGQRKGKASREMNERYRESYRSIYPKKLSSFKGFLPGDSVAEKRGNKSHLGTISDIRSGPSGPMVISATGIRHLGPRRAVACIETPEGEVTFWPMRDIVKAEAS